MWRSRKCRGTLSRCGGAQTRRRLLMNDEREGREGRKVAHGAPVKRCKGRTWMEELFKGKGMDGF